MIGGIGGSSVWVVQEAGNHTVFLNALLSGAAKSQLEYWYAAAMPQHSVILALLFSKKY
jgi:hypothetical protein